MIIAVFSREDLDCRIRGRNYYLFDTGMATAFICCQKSRGLTSLCAPPADESAGYAAAPHRMGFR